MKNPIRPRSLSSRFGVHRDASEGKTVKPPEAPQPGAPASDKWAGVDRVRVTVRLLPDDYRRLHFYAFERRLSHQEILETALMEYLNRMEDPGGGD